MRLTQIFEREGQYDWDGLPWDRDKPKPPILSEDSEERAHAISEVLALESALVPADQQTVVAMLYKLQGHYYQPGMSESLMREVAKDYIRLLAGYSVATMQEACDSFLIDPEQKFFPKVGELKKRMDNLQYNKSRRYRRLKILIGENA